MSAFNLNDLSEALDEVAEEINPRPMSQLTEEVITRITQAAAQAAVAQVAGMVPAREVSVRPEIPTYDGTRKAVDVLAFMSQLENAFELKGFTTDTQKINYFARHLVKDAQVWWNDVKAEMGRLPFNNVLELFKEAFIDANYQINVKRRLFSLKQTGSVASYVTSFRAIHRQCEPDYASEQLYKDLFLFGLEPNVQSQVRAQDCATLEACIRTALNVGSVQRNQPSRRSGNDRSRSARPTSYSASSNFGNGDMMDVDAVNLEDNSRYAKYKCFHCKQIGHIKEQCPKRLKG